MEIQSVKVFDLFGRKIEGSLSVVNRTYALSKEIHGVILVSYNSGDVRLIRKLFIP